MKNNFLVAALLIAMIFTPLSMALQRNVRVGANPVDGATVITRYDGSNILPSNYVQGAEQQGYYQNLMFESSNTTIPEASGMNLVDEAFLAEKEAKEAEMKAERWDDSGHRLSNYSSRSARLRNSWANRFE